jgi:septal ring factor EnvC (AmiA/AmiB activator)
MCSSVLLRADSRDLAIGADNHAAAGHGWDGILNAVLPRAICGLWRSIWLAAALTLTAAAPAYGEKKPPEIKQKRSELKELKGRIDSLRQEVSEAEESRADVADQLKEAEQAISDASRRLRELAARRSAAQSELAVLETETTRLEQQVAEQRERLARVLRSRYQGGETETLAQLLGGGDPNQSARDAHYLTQLSRAQATLTDELRRSLDEKRRLAENVRAKSAELSSIEEDQRKEHADLLAQQNKRKQVLVRIAGDIQARRMEIDSLKRDERRLGDLIERLGRAARPARKPPSAPQVTSVAPPGPSSPAAPTAAPQAEAAPQSIARIEQVPDESASGVSFGRLKGSLHFPIRGELINRFGAPRQEGHSTWKGVFIRAPEGGDVKAVAAGRVVYADWLRGFGNLVIVDHGDSYLSVYGNNQAVFKTEGEPVRAGEAIAAVGNSGGNADSGLYFELRHQGQPLDPMKWVTLR